MLFGEDHLITIVVLSVNCFLLLCNDGGHVAHCKQVGSLGFVDVVTKATELQWDLL